jgi:hypothetical protein
MKAAGDLAGSIGELVADGALGDGHAVIDGGRGRPRLLVGLELHIIQERGLRKVTFPKVTDVMNTLPPANKGQQVVSVDAQSSVRQTADIFAIQVTIDPADSSAGTLLDDTNWTLWVVGSLLVVHTELHG